jgi:hypothetical protein
MIAAAAPVDWERPADFCRRLGIFNHRLNWNLTRWQVRGGQPVILDRRGKSGRIVGLISNPAFEQFCRQNKGPGDHGGY